MIEIAVWQDEELPFTLEYASPAFERIRQRAFDGLIALPRVGIGVGGILLGERTAGGICVTGTLELPCSHTLGPTFQLTPDEIRQSLELAKGAAAQRPVVGIYCTRTRGAIALGATDQELFNRLCPEPWQIVLVVRPLPGEPAKATVFFRRAGELAQGAVKELWEWRPLELDEEPAAVPAPVPPPARTPAPTPAVAVEPASRPTVIEMPRPVTPPPSPVRPLSPPPIVSATASPDQPAVPPQAPVPTPRRVNPQFVTNPAPPPPPALMDSWFGSPQGPLPPKVPPRLLVLAAGLVLLGVGGGMFATRDAWLPRPALELNSTEANGLLEIRWNTSAARGLDNGSLLINDGGQLDTVPLDALKLMAGSFVYKRKSDRVTVTLDLGSNRARTAFPLESAGAAPIQPGAGSTLANPPQSGPLSPFGTPPQGSPGAGAPVAPGTAPAAGPAR